MTRQGKFAISNTPDVNVSKISGTATSVGNGTSGSSVQRVTIASDSTGQVAIAGTATVAQTASTLATGTLQNAVSSSGNTRYGPVPGRQLIAAWLKAGYVEADFFHTTDSGTPQGGIIPPRLLNVAVCSSISVRHTVAFTWEPTVVHLVDYPFMSSNLMSHYLRILINL